MIAIEEALIKNRKERISYYKRKKIIINKILNYYKYSIIFNNKLEKYLNKALILYNNFKKKNKYENDFLEKYTNHILNVSDEGFIFYDFSKKNIEYKINTIFRQSFFSLFNLDLKI
jgi:hypothetical protein